MAAQTLVRSRAFALLLLALLAAGAVQQTLVVSEYLREDPFARRLLLDADVYWTWSGDIAAGRLVGATPFLSAPLYAYLLGLVRALGGGLATVYALQGALRLATAALLALCGRRRFSGAVGLAAAGIYLTLTDPAAESCRVLNGTLQAFLAVAALQQMFRVQETPRPGRLWALGALLGVNALANPPMLAAIPLAALWVALAGDRGARRPLRAVPVLAAALLALAPATLHNWLACREVILVSSQAGITFAHGNEPGADGTYFGVPGVSTDRKRQNRDALRMVQAATGRSTWRAVNAYFLRRGLENWAADPGWAVGLAARKAWWFLAGRNYGDIYLPTLERDDGYLDRLTLAPLPVAWCALPALASLVFLGLRRRAPEWLLALLPMAVVCVFWYTPRYRLPAVPMLALLAAWSLERIVAAWRRPSLATAGLALAWVAGLASGPLNAAVGIDRPDGARASYERKLGQAYLEDGRFAQAQIHLERALQLQPDNIDARALLAETFRQRGEAERALPILRELASEAEDNSLVHAFLALTLAEQATKSRDPDLAAEAEAALKDFIAREPDDWQGPWNFGMFLDSFGRLEEAVYQYEEAVRLGSARPEVAMRLAQTRAELLDFYRAQAPSNPSVANALAWRLAAAPDPSAAALDEALRWAQAANEATGYADPDHLDTLALVLAQLGRLQEAVATAEKALEAARAGGRQDLAPDIQERLRDYRARAAYRMER